ncbi:MAG: RagB/SusD family nutrient uptake outer membrane protein [Cyclobacteriaceae bacterium]
MRNLTIIITVAVLTVGILIACNDDFLEIPVQGTLSEEALGDQDGVEASLIAAYSMLDGYADYGDWGTAASNWIFGSVASDDAYKGSEPGDQQPVTDVEFYQWSTGGADSYLRDKWRVLYDGVSRTNSALRLLESVEGIPEDVQNRIRGEALFLRAHYHFDAYKLWKNIPYYTEEDEDYRKANDVDVMPLIIADFNEAISLLPETQAEVGRATQWTAKAYLGKVLLYNEDYSGAMNMLNDVVDNGPYALEECYHDVFSATSDNGPETVLAYQSSSDDGDDDGDNGNYSDRLIFPHSGSPLGCCGFHQPSQNLVNAYKVDASGLPFLDGSFDNSDVTVATAVDPRLDWVVGRDDVPFLDWGLHAPGWIRDRPWAGPYSAKKSVYEQGSGAGGSVGWSPYQLNSLNLYLLRYSDVLLLLAEAEVEAGSLERARELVNMVRTRAANCAQGPDGVAVATAIDDPAITWANYDIGIYTAPWADQEAARTAVRMERRLELALEGHRFFDLRRWGIAQDVLNDYVAGEKERRNYLNAASPYEARHALYPLPTFEIEISTVEGEERLVQNPGW